MESPEDKKIYEKSLKRGKKFFEECLGAKYRAAALYAFMGTFFSHLKSKKSRRIRRVGTSQIPIRKPHSRFLDHERAF